MADHGAGGERLATVSIAAVVGLVGPDVLSSVPVTIVALGQRTLRVEGATPLAPGDVVALACDLPGAAPTAEGRVSVLAVAVATDRPEAVGPTWRSALSIEQIDAADGERLAAVAARAEFRGGRR